MLLKLLFGSTTTTLESAPSVDIHSESRKSGSAFAKLREFSVASSFWCQLSNAVHERNFSSNDVLILKMS
jgi:hypothetical protein